MSKIKYYMVAASVLIGNLSGCIEIDNLDRISDNNQTFVNDKNQKVVIITQEDKKNFHNIIYSYDMIINEVSCEYISDEQAYLYCYLVNKNFIDSKYKIDNKIVIPEFVYLDLFDQHLKNFIIVNTDKWVDKYSKQISNFVMVDDNNKIEGVNKDTGQWFELISYENNNVVIDYNFEDMPYTYEIKKCSQDKDKIIVYVDHCLKNEITSSEGIIGNIGDVSQEWRYWLKVRNEKYFVVNKELLKDNFPHLK